MAKNENLDRYAAHLLADIDQVKAVLVDLKGRLDESPAPEPHAVARTWVELRRMWVKLAKLRKGLEPKDKPAGLFS